MFCRKSPDVNGHDGALELFLYLNKLGITGNGLLEGGMMPLTDMLSNV